MYGFLLALLVLDGIFLSVVILLQSGKGGGLAAVGGSGGTMADGVLCPSCRRVPAPRSR
jgi:protein translocase SecG subunit